MSKTKVFLRDETAPRFRIARMFRVGEKVEIEMIGSEETPSEAMQRVFSEPGRVVAVDRRGDIYVDNHEPIQERS
jgi:hypothetical protein